MGLATLIALFYAEEDWRGWHAWNKFKREWEAKGEKFDMAGVAPAAVPDGQNFALTPIVFTSYGSMLTRDGKAIPWKDRDPNFVDRLNMDIGDLNWKTNATGYWAKDATSNLKLWQDFYRSLAATTNEFPVAPQPQSPAQDVLLALSKYDSTVEELRQAGQLPYSRFPLEYDKDDPAAILLPHLADMKRCAQVLQLRAIAELQNGQLEKALDDVKLSLRLIDSVRTEPILISHLVRIAMLQIVLQPVYEGLAEHKWSEAQLLELDSELAKLDFLADYQLSMRGEMGFQGGTIEFLRHHPEQLNDLMNDMGDDGDNSNSRSGNSPAILFPGGWFYQNRLGCADLMVNFYIPLANMNQRTVSPAALRHADKALQAQTRKTTPYNFLEKMLLPALGAAVKKYACAQISTDLARVAIALERYRLAHGEFPETLDALAPQFIEKLPHDIIGGQPLHYRRTDDGQFILYSVGWNETDDGGVVILKKSSTPEVDRDKGDWVWRYPKK